MEACKFCGYTYGVKDLMCPRHRELFSLISENVDTAIEMLRIITTPPPESKAKQEGWIGVDLDGTLAEYNGWKGVDHIGNPIPLMVERVKKLLLDGANVRIFTARVHPNQDGRKIEMVRYWIEKWCLEVFGEVLPITHEKDFGMIHLYDDRAVQVEFNTGKLVGYPHD